MCIYRESAVPVYKDVIGISHIFEIESAMYSFMAMHILIGCERKIPDYFTFVCHFLDGGHRLYRFVSLQHIYIYIGI